MFHAGREPHTVEHTTPTGATVRLESETLWVSLRHGHGGSVLAYHRPVRVEGGGRRIAVRDHTAIVRGLALAVALSIPLIRRMR
jgi:hypothetical protein